MLAEIITIGDEILIGQIVDTNSTFIAKELNAIGVSVYQITSIQDREEAILKALDEAEQRVDVIIITGGLGPTKDDITKATLCKYFDDVLVENQNVLSHIVALFAREQIPISKLNRNQAKLPSKACILPNAHGTASGMWFEKNSKLFIALPGVPFEMKTIIKNEVLHRLQNKYDFPCIVHKTIITYGLGESLLAERIAEWEVGLPKNVRLAYLPTFGKVRLRLSAKGKDYTILNTQVDKSIAQLKPLIEDNYLGLEEDEESIEANIAKLLNEREETLATAESCTGGNIARMLVSIPGSSGFYKGSVVTYATESKINVLQLDKKIIAKYSVVSAAITEAMAVKVQRMFNTTYAIATTGNAGPTKGDSDEDIGTVFIAIATPSGVFSKKMNFGLHREKTINRASNEALLMLRKEILKK